MCVQNLITCHHMYIYINLTHICPVQTVQILTGVMIFLFGIERSSHYTYGFGYAFSVFTGINLLGIPCCKFLLLALLASDFNFQNEVEHALWFFQYISAGSLSVSAQNKLNPCVVRTYNVISFSFLTLRCIHTIQFILLFKYCAIYTTKSTKPFYYLLIQ